MPDTEPLIDYGDSAILYFDGVAACEVIHGVVRMKAFVRRKNLITGTVERVVVASFVRPVEGVLDAFAALTRAVQMETKTAQTELRLN